MRVTGVPQCCGAAFVCSEESYAEQAGRIERRGIGGDYGPDGKYHPIQGPMSLKDCEKALANFNNMPGIDEAKAEVAMVSGLYNLTPQGIDKAINDLMHYPTLAIAIGRMEFLTSEMQAAGWQAVLQWTAPHGGGDLYLFACPRKNRSGAGGKMTILQPQEPPSKDAKKAGEQLQEIAKEQLQKAVAAAKMPDPVANVKIDY